MGQQRQIAVLFVLCFFFPSNRLLLGRWTQNQIAPSAQLFHFNNRLLVRIRIKVLDLFLTSSINFSTMSNNRAACNISIVRLFIQSYSQQTKYYTHTDIVRPALVPLKFHLVQPKSKNSIKNGWCFNFSLYNSSQKVSYSMMDSIVYRF